MHLINGRERRRRMQQGLNAAWEQAGHIPEDPGLRDAYRSLPRAPIRMLVGPLNKDINQGGLLRLSESFRIERLELTPEEDGAVDMAATRGTRKSQPWRWRPYEEGVAAAKAEGYFTVAVTLSDRAVAFDQIEWRFPLALVMGAELEGVSAEVEAACDASVAIPLYGMVQSLNVVCAAGIVLQNAAAAYARQHPEFQPARQASRRLLGLPPVDYTEL